ncbi:MAG: type I methionyl aminopeptidase [Candidatus Pacebacteria bacterium CG_4_10_14_0_8_um_filter_43_12]|nr:MAG: type I methionyl aminopeptidase [Candidatus Pacebacteria bacterium CG10_big_fil_rev_8_21_14_0_10_44_11]PIY79538.1 MAG: type I methionyl aminopeptidase [Candidatus Pacebacteria bacterium CG_4_10_14_0_8_um_filter_43_12]
MKTEKITAMKQGGAVLGLIRDQLAQSTKVGASFAQIEASAQQLIADHGMKPSFSTVPGYDWATCIMKNNELCHGIPTQEKVVKAGDVITIDIGLINQGYHLDTTTTFAIEPISTKTQAFLAVGIKALEKAIGQVKAGVSVYEISQAMQHTVEKAGYSAVTQLTGHGVGEQLHMAPNIPCVAYRHDKKVRLSEGQTVAIEIMYAQGNATVVLDRDGWTYRTEDGSLAGMFEETVLVTADGYQILTNPTKK